MTHPSPVLSASAARKGWRRCLPEIITLAQPRLWWALLFLTVLVALPWITELGQQSFYLSLATRVLIMAIAASGVNLLMGYGGLVSMGHAMFVGIGVYAVGLCSYHGVHSGWVQLAFAFGVSTLVALITGLVSLRTRSIAFIMITLAFGQMLYFFTISLQRYGGDDGLAIAVRSNFSPLPSLSNRVVLYYLALALLLLTMYGVWRVIHSRFGFVLRGFKANEERMLSAGFPRIRYQLSAYVASALLCSVAGVLLANLTQFASPSYLSWHASGDYILMVVLGGLGTVFGPLVGAVVFLVLEEVLSAYTQHWMALIGLFVFFVALFAKRGIWGGLTADSSRTKGAE